MSLKSPGKVATTWEKQIKIIQTAVVNNTGPRPQPQRPVSDRPRPSTETFRGRAAWTASRVRVVTGTGGSSSESAAAAARRCGGCALCPEPSEPPAGTGPSGGGAPLRGGGGGGGGRETPLMPGRGRPRSELIQTDAEYSRSRDTATGLRARSCTRGE